MDDAQVLEDRGEPDGSVAWAGEQSSGRGRFPGRIWHGQRERSLLFTVFWSPARFRVSTFAPSLVVGLGLCLWLENLGLPAGSIPSLKWPNDLYLAGRKAAGILVRQRWTASGPGAIHAGIGINLQPPSSDEGFRTSPASLAEFGRMMTPSQALEGLLPALAVALDHPDPRSACEARLWCLGQETELTLPEGTTVRGTVRGLDEAGRLFWEGSGTIEALSSGE